MISVSPYGIVIFEDKGHICKVIAAMLISTSISTLLDPGIWSLAPASTMVRLRLQRAATKSSCTTGIDRDRAGIARDRAGTARDRAGIARDRAGIARDKWNNWSYPKHLKLSLRLNQKQYVCMFR